jgi:hypothetical protein
VHLIPILPLVMIASEEDYNPGTLLLCVSTYIFICIN